MSVIQWDSNQWGRSGAGGAQIAPSDANWDSGGFVYSTTAPMPNVSDRYASDKASTFVPVKKTFSAVGTVVVSFWWLPPLTAVTDIIFQVADGANIQCTVQCVPNAGKHQLQVINGSAGAIQVTGPTLFSRIWRWVTIKLPIDNSVTVTCKVDGFSEFATPALDTRAAGGAQCTSVSFLPQNFPSNKICCQVINDTASAVMNDVLLPQRGAVQYPTGADAGTFNDWTALSGTRTSCVDETADLASVNPNDDTDYVKSGTVGQKQSFPITAVPAGITINAYRVAWRIKKDDATPRQARAFIRNAAGTIFNFATRTIGSSYETFCEDMVLSPFTGLAFTKVEVDGYQLGVEVIT